MSHDVTAGTAHGGVHGGINAPQVNTCLSALSNINIGLREHKATVCILEGCISPGYAFAVI